MATALTTPPSSSLSSTPSILSKPHLLSFSHRLTPTPSTLSFPHLSLSSSPFPRHLLSTKPKSQISSSLKNNNSKPRLSGLKEEKSVHEGSITESLPNGSPGYLNLTSRRRSFKVMSRRGTSEVRVTKSDPVYRNRLVNMLVNRILKSGKKSLAYQIMYRALKRIQQKTETNPLTVLRQAILQVTPVVAVKARRVGGSTQQVPTEIGTTQGKALAIRWLLAASRKRPGRDMAFKLSSELVDAAKGSGDAIRKKEETHRMAEANRAFAHFR